MTPQMSSRMPSASTSRRLLRAKSTKKLIMDGSVSLFYPVLKFEGIGDHLLTGPEAGDHLLHVSGKPPSVGDFDTLKIPLSHATNNPLPALELNNCLRPYS